MEQITAAGGYPLVAVATATGTTKSSRNVSGKSGHARAVADRYLQVEQSGAWQRQRTTSWTAPSKSSSGSENFIGDPVTLSFQSQQTSDVMAHQRGVSTYTKTRPAALLSTRKTDLTQPTQTATETPETRRIVRQAYGSAVSNMSQSTSHPGSLLSVFA